MGGKVMSPRAGKQFRTSEQSGDLPIAQQHAAGIDVHAAAHFVAVPAADVPAGFVNPDPKLPLGVRKFATNTADLEALAAWLKKCGVKTVAMESTGVYWIALFDLLARQGFAVILVNSRQSKHAPGRPKSDVLDCQWLQRLHSYGLLTASFRPADEIVAWRSFQRQREMLIRYAAQHVQHMQKVLEEMNVKLTEVVCVNVTRRSRPACAPWRTRARLRPCRRTRGNACASGTRMRRASARGPCCFGCPASI
jgi:transposase